MTQVIERSSVRSHLFFPAKYTHTLSLVRLVGLKVLPVPGALLGLLLLLGFGFRLFSRLSARRGAGRIAGAAAALALATHWASNAEASDASAAVGNRCDLLAALMATLAVCILVYARTFGRGHDRSAGSNRFQTGLGGVQRGCVRGWCAELVRTMTSEAS